MAIEYKYCKMKWDGGEIDSILKIYNHIELPDGVIKKLREEFESMPAPEKGDIALIPILPPFQRRHSNLVDKEGNPVAGKPKPTPPPKPVKKEIPKLNPVVEPEPVPETTAEIKSEPATQRKVKAAPKPPDSTSKKQIKKASDNVKKKSSKQERLAKRRAQPKKTAITETKQKVPNKVNYKTFPFTISSPMNTIEAIIRNYNDMNMSRAILNKLVYEFSEINADKMPPKLGQQVDVPVLLPFVYRHENNNKVK